MAYGLEKQKFIASVSNETEIPFLIWLKINKQISMNNQVICDKCRVRYYKLEMQWQGEMGDLYIAYPH